MFRPRALNSLVDELSRLPGIGEKTAQRLAFFILRSPSIRAERLAQAIVEVKEKILFCSQCSGITETDPCSLCTDPARDRSLICVVEDPSDVFLVERTGAFKGLYHVLMGALSPLDGIGPEQLKIDTLLERVDAGGVHEVICATNPNMEGEATVLYLAKLMKPRGIRLTRLAHGLPVGGHLEYADEVTLSRSLEGRHDL
ncbi:MAG: recombination mediator RecR [Candidatus Tectomicrobia bacterium]|nr:recombination mediator RecR [Candidatus Tectomicrobia bacterium]